MPIQCVIYFSNPQNIGTMIDLVQQLFKFISVHKKFWLLPIVFVMLFFGLLLIFIQSSAISPLIYTLF